MKKNEIKKLVDKCFYYEKDYDSEKIRFIYFYEEVRNILENEEYNDLEVYDYLSSKIKIAGEYKGDFIDENKEELKFQYIYLREMFIDDLTRFNKYGLSPFEREYNGRSDLLKMEFRVLRKALKNRESLTLELLKKLSKEESKELIEDINIFLRSLPNYMGNAKEKGVIENYILKFKEVIDDNEKTPLSGKESKTKLNKEIELKFEDLLLLKGYSDSQKKLFIEKLKVEFKKDYSVSRRRNKNLALFVYALYNLNYIDISSITRTSLHRMMSQFFCVNIGTVQAFGKHIDESWKLQESCLDIEKSGYEARIQKIIFSL